METLRDGRYVLVKPLGEGTQGETHEAVDKREGRLVAIKCFRVAKAKAWKDVELAEREAKTLASLDHARLPKYLEHFEENGALYLVMERIEGESVATLRRRGRPFTAAEVLRMLVEIGEALNYLGDRSPSIIHRDIKPGNVIRRPDGSFALVDFGAVRDRLKPAGGSTVVGTFGYMAPEQFQGRATLRSDVYGVAATALAMLTGAEPEELPHAGLAIDVAKAVPRGTPKDLVRALTSMLEPDPDKRAASVDDALRNAKIDIARERRKSEEKEKKSKKELREERKEKRRQRRKVRRERQPPFVPRVLAQIGLLLGKLVVWIVVGLVVPLILGLLSMIFGKGLRTAAAACMRAAKRAGTAMSDASAWLSGERASDDEEDEEHAPAEKTRVADDGSVRVRVGDGGRSVKERPLGKMTDEEAHAWAKARADREVAEWSEEDEAIVDRRSGKR